MTEAFSAPAATAGGRRQLGLAGKLVAAMTVPLVLLVAIAAVLFAGRAADNSAAATDEGLARLEQPAQLAQAAVAAERSAVGGGTSTPATARMDGAVKRLRSAVDKTELPKGSVTATWHRVDGALDRLGSVRGLAKTDRGAAMRGYTGVLDALLGFEHAALTAPAHRGVAQHGAGIAALSTASAELANQHAILLAGIERGKLSRKESGTLHDSGVRLDAALARFRAVAPGRDRAAYDRTMVKADVGRRTALVAAALEPGPITLDSQAWTEASKAVAGQLRGASGKIDARSRSAASAEHSHTRTAMLVTGGASVVAILVAAAAAALLCRRVLRSARALQRGARTVVQSTLPEALAELRAGKVVDTEVDPLPVHGGDELGQVARAFDAVHSEARGLAAAQASMRTSYGTIFVNLSRRSQTLVQRQLGLIEQLERDEEDSEQLATLFTLDHLATRMRRNNENLMVLSGAEPNRGPSQHPIPLEEVLRAAVSEIEQYGRVTLDPPQAVTVLGYAAGDLIRLVAELLDNATAFSAPDTTVTVTADRDSDGSLLVQINDGGLGMEAAELAAINERLAGGDAEDVPASRRMGLFVVGRLAGRQGVQVALRAGTDAGVIAGVRIPSRLVAGSVVPDGGLGLDFERPEPAGRGAGETRHDGDDTVETLLPQPAEPYGATGPRPPRRPRQQPTPTGARARAQQAGTAPEVAATEERSGQGTAAEPADRTGAGSPRRTTNAQPPERTPIFDAMLPVWFTDPAQAQAQDQETQDQETQEERAQDERAQRDATALADADTATHHDDAGAGGELETASTGAAQDRWQSPADAGWQAVEEVAGVEPETFTTAGLPQRTPRARLLPGSAPEPERPAGGPKHGADSVRSRLADFQRGLQRGRHSSGAEPPEPAAADHVENTELFAPEDPGAASGQIPQQSGAASWAFSASEEPPATSGVQHGTDTPTEVLTPAGLPRRTPHATRSSDAEQASQAGDPIGGADADGMRSRLANFQRGVSAGRRSTGMPEQELDENEHAYQWEKE